jgi:hypothetical protein
VRAWIRARRKERAGRRNQKALDRLHGRNAQPPRRFRGGSGRRGGDSDWGDVIGDVLGDLIEALFKIFD